MSTLLQTLNDHAANLERVRSEAEQAVVAAAWAYVTAEVVAYSKAHPRRRVTFCSAMGAVTLHVQRGGWMGRDLNGPNSEYSWGDGAHHDDNPPAFVVELQRIAEETGLEWSMTGSRLLECKGGEIVRDLEHW